MMKAAEGFGTVRTDLALEERERFPGQDKEVSGVSLREWKPEEEGVRITEVKILNDRGAKAMGKEKGSCPSMRSSFFSNSSSISRWATPVFSIMCLT